MADESNENQAQDKRPMRSSRHIAAGEVRRRLIDSGKGKIGKQNKLPLSKAIEISIKSIRVRFWRSLITMSGIILAIAFLMWIWTDAAMIKALSKTEDPVLLLMLAKKGYSTKSTTLSRGDQAAATGKDDSSAKNSWLVTLSLLVAGVGIINAMLMSVTERFQEIGTMKCLGALDSFIVKLFLLESSFQGTLGTMIGIGIGLLLNLVWNWISFGSTFFFGYISYALGDIGWNIVIAMAIGSILSVLGALYPVWVAARMEPVVAMQVNQ